MTLHFGGCQARHSDVDCFNLGNYIRRFSLFAHVGSVAGFGRRNPFASVHASHH